MHNELLQDFEDQILSKMLSGLLWVTSIAVHELDSKGLLLFNVLYSLIPPLIFNKQNKNH